MNSNPLVSVIIPNYNHARYLDQCLPVRFTYDNNYFNDKYQGVLVGGYNALIGKLLEGVEARTGCDFFEGYKDYSVNDDRNDALADWYRSLADLDENVIFGGRLAEDRYYDMAPVIEKAMAAAAGITKVSDSF